MTVNTHSMSKPYAQDPDPHWCQFCRREATFWSQDEQGPKALGRSVFHCRPHREQGRREARRIGGGSIPFLGQPAGQGADEYGLPSPL